MAGLIALLPMLPPGSLDPASAGLNPAAPGNLLHALAVLGGPVLALVLALLCLVTSFALVVFVLPRVKWRDDLDGPRP